MSSASKPAEEQPLTNEQGQISPIFLLQQFMSTYCQEKDVEEVPHADMLAGVKKIASDYALDDGEVVMLLCNSLITEADLESKESDEPINQVEKYAFLFHRYVKKSKQQKKLLAYMSALYKKNKKKLHFLPVMVMQFYNEYLLDASVLREWVKKKQEKSSSFTIKMCAAMKPIMDRLDEVEQ